MLRKSFYSVFILIVVIVSCDQNNSFPKLIHTTKWYEIIQNNANDTLHKYGIENYKDSAFWYLYIYFGKAAIEKCRTVNIDSVVVDNRKRKIIYHDLALTKVRIDGDFVYLHAVPLINDSILSCNTVEGCQLPDEIKFNYKLKTFHGFIYDENSLLTVSASPLSYYQRILRKVLINDTAYNIRPHKKFTDLFLRIAQNEKL